MGRVEVAIGRAIDRERKRRQEVETARRVVAPLVGDVLGMDSAAEIYSHTLRQHGVVPGGAGTAALQTMVRMLLNGNGSGVVSAPSFAIATDEASMATDYGVPTPRKL
ncbi:hypothetical protein OQ496_03280 [Acetobacter suratthaniensis]|uniref:Uncharacterized protein n=1 Tax=Acetobacter suratthaniensis TaxID=1502841 RepID=A0ABS3LH52_9PROT|nr:hypothetical protein [Acetobacter suratthaniensis]MBO1326912.1 hypothetical protein [Acetobacter suratthaniensis]MCX2565478.1 hypothetical protein [Acetobacter suratthaniensis]